MPTRLTGQTACGLRGATDVVSRRWLGFAASDEPTADLCLPEALMTAHEQHASFGMDQGSTNGLRRARPCFPVRARTIFPRPDGRRTARLRSSLPCSRWRRPCWQRLARSGGGRDWRPVMSAPQHPDAQGDGETGSVHGLEYRQCRRTT